MSSPKAIGFTLYDINGAPLPGQIPVFLTYCEETGTDIPAPAIIEIKGGGYYFIPTFNVNRDLYYLIDGGVNSFPRYYSELLRYESFNVDLLPNIDTNAATAASESTTAATQATTAATESTTAAAQATIAATEATIARKCGTNSRNVDPLTKREILLDDDGVTPFVRWNLFDDLNAPTTGPNIFKKTKI